MKAFALAASISPWALALAAEVDVRGWSVALCELVGRAGVGDFRDGQVDQVCHGDPVAANNRRLLVLELTSIFRAAWPSPMNSGLVDCRA